MSADGALVEGAALPDAGALVQLIRGTLIVHGLVIWSSHGRCGLKFSGSVDVERWRAAPTNVEQQRVDDVVRLVKAGAVPLPVEPLGVQGRGGDTSNAAEEIAGDLRRVSELLDDLGEVLAGDPDLVSRHGTALQNLDIAMQVLDALQSTVACRNEQGYDSNKLAGLRRSADQALNSAASAQ